MSNSKTKKNSQKHIAKKIEKRVGELKNLNKTSLIPAINIRPPQLSPIVVKKVESSPVVAPKPVIAQKEPDTVAVSPIVKNVEIPTAISSFVPKPVVLNKSFMDKTKLFLNGKHVFLNGKIILLNWHIILIVFLLVLVITFVSLWAAGVFNPPKNDCELAAEAKAALDQANAFLVRKQIELTNAQKARDAAKALVDANPVNGASVASAQAALVVAQKSYDDAQQLYALAQGQIDSLTNLVNNFRQLATSLSNIVTTDQEIVNKEASITSLTAVQTAAQTAYDKALAAYKATYGHDPNSDTSTVLNNEITTNQTNYENANTAANTLQANLPIVCGGPSAAEVFGWIFTVIFFIIIVMLVIDIFFGGKILEKNNKWILWRYYKS